MGNPMSPMGAPMADNGHKKVGPIVATLVIVLVLIIAALYLFASRVNKEAVPMDNSSTAINNSSATINATPSVPTVTNSANDPASLQTDLNASTKNLDSQNF